MRLGTSNPHAHELPDVAMDFNLPALRESLTQNLYDFLNTEVDLGISLRNALTTLEAIGHFKGRLPPDLKMEIETRRSELAARISPL
jgi:hypothetical protein